MRHVQLFRIAYTGSKLQPGSLDMYPNRRDGPLEAWFKLMDILAFLFWHTSNGSILEFTVAGSKWKVFTSASPPLVDSRDRQQRQYPSAVSVSSHCVAWARRRRILSNRVTIIEKHNVHFPRDSVRVIWKCEKAHSDILEWYWTTRYLPILQWLVRYLSLHFHAFSFRS